MGKTDRPKEITLPQVYLEHAVFSDDDESDEEYIIELGNDILIITDNNANLNDDSDSETIFSDDDEEQEVETLSSHSDMDLLSLEWGQSESNYIIEEVSDSLDSIVDEYLSDSDESDHSFSNDSDSNSDDDDDSDSSVESEPEELDNSVAFDYDNPPDVYTNFSQSDDEYEHFSDGSG